MAANNPYAPPGATVADIGDGQPATQPVRVFSSKGRIGRLRFLCYLAVTYLVGSLILGASFGIAMVGGSSFGITAIAMSAFAFVTLWLLILWGIQRSHDMGWSGWAAIGVLIPFVGLLWFVIPGNPGPNRYGPPPPPNGTGVVVGALLFPALFLLGFVAGLAVPAYQDYVKRAGTAQSR